LQIKLPYPFSTLVRFFSILSLDVLNPDCLYAKTRVYRSVYFFSIGPAILTAANFVVYLFRQLAPGDWTPNELKRQHTFVFLVGTFVALPSVLRVQFSALDCMPIGKGKSYLREDTSVDCTTGSYKSFRTLDVFLILGYASIPVIWFWLLWRQRKTFAALDGSSKSDKTTIMQFKHLSFLFEPYKTTFYAFEVFETYRRVIFIGVLPLLTQNSPRRAAIGVVMSVCSLAFYREFEPFSRRANNLLVYVAQYTILVTFLTGWAIDSDVGKHVDPLFFGVLLLITNVVIVVLACYMGGKRLIREEYKDRRRAEWRKMLTTQEVKLVGKVMGESHTTGETIEMNPTLAARMGNSEKTWKVLRQILLRPTDVVIESHLGVGAFGDVFKANCLGQPVAVKKMKTINEENLRMFRAEVLLHATLRHPNIVAFVGACWSQNMVALVLELLPKGSMTKLLTEKGLVWDNPLLRLVTDCARGMTYLHSREYTDEVTEATHKCVLHRDLKPDNVLVTNYIGAKIADFGTSRAMDS